MQSSRKKKTRIKELKCETCQIQALTTKPHKEQHRIVEMLHLTQDIKKQFIVCYSMGYLKHM